MDPPVQVASPPLTAFLAEIRPKIRLLAVGFNGQIRKGTPFSLDSALHLGEVCAGRTALGFSPVVVRTHILRSARASTGTGVRDICRGQETLQRSRDGAPPID